MSQISELRQQARAAQRRASNKASRLRREVGVEINGTSFDVRKPAKEIASLNSRQLRSHINNLNKFNSRTTQFVPGAQGAPLPRAAAFKFAQVQAKHNAVVEAHYSSIQGIKMPGSTATSGNTIGERDSMLKPKKFGAMALQKRIYSKHDIQLSQIADASALKTLTADLERRMSPSYFKSKIGQNRESAIKMIQNGTGDENVVAWINSLNDHQFNVLWSYTDLPEKLAFEIDSDKTGNAEPDDIQQALNTSGKSDVKAEYAEWVAALPIQTRAATNQQQKPKRGKTR